MTTDARERGIVISNSPRLMRSGLTGRVYVVTRWVDAGNGVIEARKKFDVTEDFKSLVVRGDLDPPTASEQGASQ